MLISYVFALVSSGAITEKDLDTQAEGFIKEELEAVELAAAKEGEPIKYTSLSSLSFVYDHHSFCCLFRMPSVDFEVDDAVDKLARLGLARVNGDKGQYYFSNISFFKKFQYFFSKKPMTGARIIEAVPLEEAITNLQVFICLLLLLFYTNNNDFFLFEIRKWLMKALQLNRKEHQALLNKSIKKQKLF